MKLFDRNKYKLLLALSFVALLLFGFMSFMNPGEKAKHRQVYFVDVKNSQVHWRMDLHHGIIPLSEGKLIFENDKLVDAQFKVAMDSLRDVDIEYKLMRDIYQNTIKSKEIFNTSRFPYGYFRLYSTEQLSKDNLLLTGDFELMEIENCIQFKTSLSFKGDSLIANTDTIGIDRINWGIIALSKTFGKSVDSYVVSDTIRLQVHIEGVLIGKQERRQQRGSSGKGK